MKLLIVTQKIDKNDPVLGFFHRWVEEFAKHYSLVFVIAGFVGEYSLPENVRIFSLGKDKGFNKLRRIWRYWEFFSKYYAKSEAVFFHMCPEFVLASSPFLLSLNRVSSLWYIHRNINWRVRIAEKLVDYVFTAAEASFRLPSKKVIYTGHAIDTDFFRPSKNFNNPGGTVRLLMVGRISPIKDFETVIRACAILKNDWDREWALSITGGTVLPRDQVYLESIKKIIKEKGLEKRIVFLGAHSYLDMPSIYNDHHILLSTTPTGSFDKAVLEAMASGLTVITANEAFRSILPPAYFLEGHTPESLAAKIQALADENRPVLQLREIVVRRHGLSATIKKITTSLRL